MKHLPILFITTLLGSAFCQAAIPLATFTLNANFSPNISEVAAPYNGTATFSYFNSAAFADGSYSLSTFFNYGISITVGGASFTEADLIPDSTTTIEIRGSSFFFSRTGNLSTGSANFLNSDGIFLSTEPVATGNLNQFSARYGLGPAGGGGLGPNPLFGNYGLGTIPEVSTSLLSAIACGFGVLRRRR